MGKIQGLDKLQRRLRSVGSAKANRLLGQALFHGGELVKVEAQLSITSGAVSGKGHVPSRPGEPPSNDTGTLANYIDVTHRSGELEANVASHAPYSEALEFGTSRVEARPFFRPARDKKKKEARRIMQAAVNKIIAGGAE